jgi:hypothetical protein
LTQRENWILEAREKSMVHAVTGDPPHHKLEAAVLTNVTAQTHIGGAADSRDGWIAQLDLELTIFFIFFFFPLLVKQ